MAQQSINVGVIANDGTGDSLHDGGVKINDNFTELYAADIALASATTTLAGRVTTAESDIDILQAAGSGSSAVYYLTTMTAAATATANAAALTADIIAAQGKMVVIPGVGYFFGGGSTSVAAVDITFSEAQSVYLKFMPGAVLTCNTAGKNSTSMFFAFRENVVAEIDGGRFDGGSIAEIFVRTSDTAAPGVEMTVKNAKVHNFGWTTADSGTASFNGTVGVLCSNSKRMVIDNCQFYDFRSREDATTGNQPGKSCFLQWLNAGSTAANSFAYSITNCEFDYGAETNEGNDCDAIHILQQWPAAPAAGVLLDCRFKFHGKSRRVLKYQGGGIHKVSNCHMTPTATWTASTTGATSIVITAATAATPGVFTTGSTHAIPTGTYTKLSAMLGSASWTALNDVEFMVVPVSATTFQLYGPGAYIDTTGLGTYVPASPTNPGTVRRTNGQGNAMTVNQAGTVAATGVWTTQYGAVIAAHGFVTGEMIRVENMAGGTWATLNNIDYYVEVLSTTTFKIKAASLLDTSTYGAYAGSSGSITRVNGCSIKGHNGIDWAGGNDGLLEIDNCHLNLSGFRNGVVQSIGVGGTVRISNSVIIGNRYDANRIIPDTGAAEVGQPVGFNTGGLDNESSIINCDVYGWARAVTLAGYNNKCVGNRFIDPRTYWIQTGTTGRDGLIVTDNEVITRTPYSLDVSSDAVTADFHRSGEIRDFTNVNISRNRLIQKGNTLHSTGFICFVTNGVTGLAEDNIAPDGCLAIRYTTGVTPVNIKTATATAGAATLAARRGKITTEALTTAAGDTPYTLTLTNSLIVAGDMVMVKVANGTNTAGIPFVGRVTEAAGSVVILIFNKHSANAFNGTLVVSFNLLKS